MASLAIVSLLGLEILSVLPSVIQTSPDIRASTVFIKITCQSKLGSVSYIPNGGDIVPKGTEIGGEGMGK